MTIQRNCFIKLFQNKKAMRKILRLFVACCLLMLLMPANLLAQERTITGTVLSDDNKSPLQGVTIRVKGTKRFTQTDANGKFTIKMNPSLSAREALSKIERVFKKYNPAIPFEPNFVDEEFGKKIR